MKFFLDYILNFSASLLQNLGILCVHLGAFHWQGLAVVWPQGFRKMVSNTEVFVLEVLLWLQCVDQLQEVHSAGGESSEAALVPCTSVEITKEGK